RRKQRPPKSGSGAKRRRPSVQHARPKKRPRLVVETDVAGLLWPVATLAGIEGADAFEVGRALAREGDPFADAERLRAVVDEGQSEWYVGGKRQPVEAGLPVRRFPARALRGDGEVEAVA